MSIHIVGARGPLCGAKSDNLEITDDIRLSTCKRCINMTMHKEAKEKRNEEPQRESYLAVIVVIAFFSALAFVGVLMFSKTLCDGDCGILPLRNPYEATPSSQMSDLLEESIKNVK